MENSSRFRSRVTRLLAVVFWPLTGWRLKTLAVGAIYLAGVQFLQFRSTPGLRCRIPFETQQVFVAFSPDESMILTVGTSPTTNDPTLMPAAIWDSRTGECLGCLPSINPRVGRWQFSSDSKSFAILDKPNRAISIHELPGLRKVASVAYADGHLTPSFSFCPDGDLIVCDCEKGVQRWNWRTDSKTLLVPPPFIEAVCHLPKTTTNDCMLLIIRHAGKPLPPISLELRDSRNGKLLRELGVCHYWDQKGDGNFWGIDDPDVRAVSTGVAVEFTPNGRWMAVEFHIRNFFHRSDSIQKLNPPDRPLWLFQVAQDFATFPRDAKLSKTPCDWSSNLDNRRFASRQRPSWWLLRDGHLRTIEERGIEDVDLESRKIAKVVDWPRWPNESSLTGWILALGGSSEVSFCRVSLRGADDYLPFYDKLSSVYDRLVRLGFFLSLDQNVELLDRRGRLIAHLALGETHDGLPEIHISPSGRLAAIETIDKVLLVLDVPWSTNWKRILPLAMIPSVVAMLIYWMVRVAWRRTRPRSHHAPP